MKIFWRRSNTQLFFPLVLLLLSFRLHSQSEYDSFIRIDTAYKSTKKGFLEVVFTQFDKHMPHFASKDDYSISESLPLKKDILKMENDPELESIGKRPAIIFYVPAEIKNKKALYNTLWDNIQILKKKANFPFVFQPIIIADSAGYFKILNGGLGKLKFNDIENFLNNINYNMTINELHGNIDTLLNKARVICFIGADFYRRPQPKVFSSIERVFSVSRKIQDPLERPVFIAYSMDSQGIPVDMKTYIDTTISNRGRSLESEAGLQSIDPGFKRKFATNFEKYFTLGYVNRYKVSVKINFPIYKGETRTLELIWNALPKNPTLYGYRFGSPERPDDIGQRKNEIPLVGLLGGIILFGFYFALMFWYPWHEKRSFEKKYVGPYKKQVGLVQYDTITNEPIEDGTIIVTSCKAIIPYNIWQMQGNKCPNYPECMYYLDCDGSGKLDSEYKFYSPTGNQRKYNWLFFGTCGGFLSWLLSFLMSPLFNFMGFGNFYELLYNSASGASKEEFVRSCIDQANVGFTSILGIGSALIIADYFSETQRSKITQPIIKILASGMLSALCFGVLFALNIHLYLKWMISWTCMALILSAAMSYKSSSVSFKNASIATLTGILLSFILFIGQDLISGFSIFSDSNVIIHIINMFKFIALGAITGYTATTVLKRLEDFELELLAPEQVGGRIIPISKALRSGSPVSIGSDPKNVIFIKWTDPGVQLLHARLELKNGDVVLVAYSPILINSIVLPADSKHTLRNNDTIQFGEHGATIMKFKLR